MISFYELLQLINLLVIMFKYEGILQPTEGKTCQFLNIYSALEPGSEFDLDSIARTL